MLIVSTLLGVALLAAPFVFNYTDNTNALWTSIVLGLLVFLVSAYKFLAQDNQKWEYWVAGVAGLVALAAPFVLDFSAITAALWATLIIGVAIVLLSAYEVLFAPPEVTI